MCVCLDEQYLIGQCSVLQDYVALRSRKSRASVDFFFTTLHSFCFLFYFPTSLCGGHPPLRRLMEMNEGSVLFAAELLSVREALQDSLVHSTAFKVWCIAADGIHFTSGT